MAAEDRHLICVRGPTVCEHLAGRVGRGRNAAHLFLSSMPSAPKGVNQKATGHDGDPCVSSARGKKSCGMLGREGHGRGPRLPWTVVVVL